MSMSIYLLLVNPNHWPTLDKLCTSPLSLPFPLAPRRPGSGTNTRIAVEYGSSRSSPTLPSKCKTFQTLAASKDEGGKMAHSLRSAGSAAINIALVASGGLDM